MTRRKAIYTEAFSHSNPIPAACQLGNILVTGIVNGIDPAKPDQPGTLEEQCALMFRRVAEIMKAAGGSTDNIVKLNVQMADVSDRKAVNVEWTKMFPDAATRPVRQTLHAVLDRGKLIQCDIMAIMDETT
jgi:2-iminobutanoate/2-iminopropanoate deaminase